MITNKEYIELFISRSFEKTIDDAILADKNFVVPRLQVIDYIHKVLEIPYRDFIEYVADNIGLITDDQLTQSSAFDSCTNRMCEAMIWQNNPGMRFIEIGQLFPDKVKVVNDGSLSKYGENQVKTASQLGLVFDYYDYWYLTCVGYVFNELTEEEQGALLARSILRIPLYRSVVTLLLQRNVSMMDYMASLSDSTKGRRSGSILKLVKTCLKECDAEGILYHNFIYPKYNAKTKTISLDVEQGSFYDISKRLFEFERLNSIPLYSIRAACGYFANDEQPEQIGWLDVSGMGLRLDKNKHFVVKAVGNSMLPTIKDRDYCVFEWADGTPYDGDIVLSQLDRRDIEYGGAYTIKKFYGSFLNGLLEEVELRPINKEEYDSIILRPYDDAEYKIIGKFVATIPKA